jgi:miniconductance mechanosensitive channel
MEGDYHVLAEVDRWLTQDLGMNAEIAIYLKMAIMATALILICAVVWFVARKIFLGIVERLADRTKTEWDDALVEAKFFKQLAHIFPALIVDYSAPYVFSGFPTIHPIVKTSTEIFIVIVVMWVVIAFLNATLYMLSKKPFLKDKPVQSYIQLAKIINYVIFGILIFSLAFNKSPIYFLTGLGAMTAVLLLIFKDTIMGFVGSLQLAANDMVRIGDWVTMTNYGADGDVIEINLATIKVRNFDRTITTIPTYAFISDSFKNWRGMTESDGRRIKRAINIKISSIKFCSPEMLDRFKNVELIKDYVANKEQELAAHNAEKNVNKSTLINGRNLTNIGVFREYAEAYLLNHSQINTDMTYMVRQLDPEETGIPLEIYAFSKDKEWVNYEGIIADIFDHLLAAIPEFDLEVFQNPTGKDFGKLTS